MSDAVFGGRLVATMALAVVASVYCGLVFADEGQPCPDETLAAVAGWAGFKGNPVPESRADSNGTVVASACKAMPDEPATTIVTVAFDLHRGEPPDQDGTKEQVVALLDRRSNRVVAGIRSTIEEDATTEVGENSYSIDTARYRLTPAIRAFGVVFDSDARGSSCGDADAGSELTLYTREGSVLRAVMGTNLHGSVGTIACGHGPASFEEAEMSVSVEKTRTNGFADLAIIANVTETIRDDQDDYHDGTVRSARTVLHYDGKSYGTDMFRTFWYSDSVKKTWGIP
jgi:hypothetical protein